MTKIFYFIISILIVGFLQTPIKVSPITLSETKETIIYALPYDFDEYSIYTANSYATKQWTGAVYSSLLKRSSTNHDWEEDLANTMPTISADGLTFTFSLKNNLKFSNGHGLTINDVEFSFHVALAPAINTNFYDSFVGFLDNNSINIINNQTVEFTLLKSFAFPYTLLSFPIIEEQFFEKRYNRCLQGVEIDCIWDDTEGLDAVSSGPFMIQNIDVIKGLVTLEANPYYYDAENIQTDKLVFKKIADKGEAIASLKNGTIDILDSQYVPGITELSDIGGVSEEIVADPAHIELSLNHLNPYYGTGDAIPGNEIASIQEKYDDSLLVRKAMSHIIDREFIVNVIWEGLATKATSAMPDSTIGFDETILHRNYSVEIARNYMEIAGFDYSTLGIETESGIFEKNFFEVTMLSPNGGSAMLQWYSNYVIELPKIGIGVKDHVSTGWGEIVPRTFGYGQSEENPNFPLPPSYEDGGFDMFAVGYGWSLDWNPKSLYDPSGRCDTGNCDNFYNFDLTEEKTDVAALIRSYLNELDFDTRIQKVGKVHNALYNNIPVLPVIYPQSHWGFNENVVGLDPLLLSNSLQDWSLVRKLSFISNIPTFPTSEGSLDFTSGWWFVIASPGAIGIISYYVDNRRRR